jgi:indolepyruvate ferredoxin oxidoreductase beta subunit
MYPNAQTTQERSRVNEMKKDIIICGVGGQGVISVASIIAKGAIKAGLRTRQSEVHGMAQRGGSVLAHLRVADRTIESDLIPRQSADLILGMEPIESLRYLEYLKRDGTFITSVDPVVNIPNYPDEEFYLSKITSLPKYVAIRAQKKAIDAGSGRAANMVMVGASSNAIDIGEDHLKDAIRETYASKGEKVVEINLKAFDLGKEEKTH